MSYRLTRESNDKFGVTNVCKTENDRHKSRAAADLIRQYRAAFRVGILIPLNQFFRRIVGGRQCAPSLTIAIR